MEGHLKLNLQFLKNMMYPYRKNYKNEKYAICKPESFIAYVVVGTLVQK